MSDIDTTELRAYISFELWLELQQLTKKQNANWHNNIDRLLRVGISETYKQWPNLKPEVKE